jgi:hypothetical protein
MVFFVNTAITGFSSAASDEANIAVEASAASTTNKLRIRH